jgi:hypothetical protein
VACEGQFQVQELGAGIPNQGVKQMQNEKTAGYCEYTPRLMEQRERKKKKGGLEFGLSIYFGT